MDEKIYGITIRRPKTIDEVFDFLAEGFDSFGMPVREDSWEVSERYNELIDSLRVGKDDSRGLIVIHEGDESVGMDGKTYLFILPDGWTYDLFFEEWMVRNQ